MSKKRKFVALALEGKVTFKALCESFNISRTLGYQLLKCYREFGEAGLLEKSHCPKTSPTRTASDLEMVIVSVRKKHPYWGAKTIHAYLTSQGLKMPSQKTVHRILSRYGLITLEESLKRKKFLRFEHVHPNDLWQMDFKGHFELEDKTRCHPLTLLDDHSRYSLGIIACSNERYLTVKTALIEVFERYGLPKRMTMDNGAPWGNANTSRLTRLTAWLIQQGITVTHSRPYHPQTQGKLERFHRTLKTELLRYYYFNNLSHAQIGFDEWRHFYNDKRPHGAIKAYSPGKIYVPSPRVYREAIPPYEYDSQMRLRKVNQKGLISYQGKRYIIGEGLGGQRIGLNHQKTSALVDVYFCHQKLGTLDLACPVDY